MTPLQVGQAAPEFILTDQNGRETKLSDYRGTTVVLVFVPFAFSAVCTQELSTVRQLSLTEERDVEVMVISCDSRYTLRAWSEAQHYYGLVLSDFWPHGDVAKAYGVFDDTKGQALRSTFTIDPDGVCEFVHIVEPGGVRSPEDFTRAVRFFD